MFKLVQGVTALLSAVAALAAVYFAGQTYTSNATSQNASAFATSASALSVTGGPDMRSQQAQHLGGIYGLQSVMQEDASRQPAVVSVLASFIEAHQRTDAQDHDSYWRQPPGGCPPAPGFALNSAPPAEVQSAFAVLAHRDPGSDDPDAQLELSTACLGYLPAAGAKMPRTRLTGADLKDAQLSRADLFGINGISLNLSGSSIEQANLAEADLRAATLSGQVDARNAFLTKARLGGADLSGINLEGADLTGAILSASADRSVILICRETGSSILTGQGPR